MTNKKNNDLSTFSNLNNIKIPNIVETIGKSLLIGLGVILFFLIATPWQQTAKGFGYVIANDPNDRAQEINSPINGKIKKWYVSDGAKVKQNDIIAEIIDNDPQILERIRSERDAKKRKLQVAQIASATAKINYERQEELLNKGLSSRKDFEEAKIEYKKLLSAMEAVASEVAESETKLSRQENQIIYAPKDGIILKVLPGNNATIVKAGDRIATFAPTLSDPAIELYINSNDIPLVYEGRKVRLQFEGWPAVQMSGWPSLAIGTFAGVVSAIDSSISENGKFRIIIKKDKNENWPDQRFLRHGSKVYGWVLLNSVQLGYEIWRQINSFPAEFDQGVVNPKQLKKDE
ncbi:MAG: efflux RND transporter periplasmic adaptor subunit [Alphaproteobacteria bacterium]